MELKKIQCPNCKANLSVDSSRNILFCEYCGQKILENDDIIRSEHTENINYTYREIDEARIKEAEVELKKLEHAENIRHTRKVNIQKNGQRNRGCCIIILIPLLILIIFMIFKGITERAISTSIISYYSEQMPKINEICEKHNASVSDTYFRNSYPSIDISVITSERDEIDSLQKELIAAIDLLDDHSLSLDFERDRYDTLRKVEIKKNGTVAIYYDKTNTLSDEQTNSIIKEYSAALKNICKTNNAAIKEAKIEEDILYLLFLVDYKNKYNIDKLQKDIVAVITELTDIQRNIIIMANNTTVREFDVYTSGAVIVNKDNSTISFTTSSSNSLDSDSNVPATPNPTTELDSIMSSQTDQDDETTQLQRIAQDDNVTMEQAADAYKKELSKQQYDHWISWIKSQNRDGVNIVYEDYLLKLLSSVDNYVDGSYNIIDAQQCIMIDKDDIDTLNSLLKESNIDQACETGDLFFYIKFSFKYGDNTPILIGLGLSDFSKNQVIPLSIDLILM